MTPFPHFDRANDEDDDNDDDDDDDIEDIDDIDDRDGDDGDDNDDDDDGDGDGDDDDFFCYTNTKAILNEQHICTMINRLYIANTLQILHVFYPKKDFADDDVRCRL